ncbi:MAG: DUF2752 domain-containing protein [Propionibacteriales bacterium]|nr:DUF2752 domain-containing protein [Propionibacteriales bacterium]
METTNHPAQTEGVLQRNPTRSSRTLLTWVAGVGASGLALTALYATTGVGFGCVMKSSTGWDCPLCGGTRMGAALLRGDLAAAWQLNAFAVVGITLGALLGIILVTERIIGRQGTLVRGAQRITESLGLTVTGRGVAFAFLAACLVWLLFRNLVLGPLP